MSKHFFRVIFPGETSCKKFPPDPFQELYTYFYCEIGYFRARFASLLNLSNAQIAVAANDVRSKRYSRDAPATILGPATQNGPQDSFYMEILCFYANRAFVNEALPQTLYQQILYTRQRIGGIGGGGAR